MGTIFCPKAPDTIMNIFLSELFLSCCTHLSASVKTCIDLITRCILAIVLRKLLSDASIFASNQTRMLLGSIDATAELSSSVDFCFDVRLEV
jgi:hypothetical protein